jgi:hypothetical protein
VFTVQCARSIDSALRAQQVAQMTSEDPPDGAGGDIDKVTLSHNTCYHAHSWLVLQQQLTACIG